MVDNKCFNHILKIKKFLFFFFLILIVSWFNRDLFASSVEQDNDYTMTFGVTIDSVCYHFPGSNYGPIDLENAKKEIDLAEELGVDFVRFDLRNEMLGFNEEIKKLDVIIDYSRTKELKIYLGVYGMETWLTRKIFDQRYRSGGAGKAYWIDFKEMYIKQTQYLAQRYKPEYMLIMVEVPFNLGNQVNSVRKIDDWVNYTIKVSKIIKSVTPKTKIVLNQILRNEWPTLEFAEKIMERGVKVIDIISADPYSYDDLNEEILNLVRIKNKYDWAGDIWIGETNIFDVEKLYHESTKEEDDYQKDYFIYAIDMAKKNNLNGFGIFYFLDTKYNRGMGIINEKFEPKSAYHSLKEKIKSR